jgi:hypothetical protein
MGNLYQSRLYSVAKEKGEYFRKTYQSSTNNESKGKWMALNLKSDLLQPIVEQKENGMLDA